MTSLASTVNGLIAVGDRGQILTKFGESDGWQQAPVPSDTLLTKVVMLDDNIGFALGHDAVILGTVDGGKSWELRQYRPDLETPLLDLQALSNDHLIAMGAYGQLFRSMDGGQSWQFEFLESLLIPDDLDYLNEIRMDSEEDYLAERAAILPHVNDLVKLSDGSLFIVGEMGLMARSEDDGHSWQRLPEIYFGSLMTMVEMGEQWLVAGLRGNAFVSEDKGQNWQSLDLDTQSTFNGHLVNGKEVMLFGNGGALVRLTPQSVRIDSIAGGQDIVDLKADASGTLWVAGSKGLAPVTIEQ
ncbi:WD40/YVTN/BNR-like repeat-containing protein [Ferrimonas aestuarii]|uniref:Photosynthesis system II assembly factor Ycf48/Hcf136-like domain-containing protein n=1 Tax=Ferrimonas aestuarii TaxID=2569539 RepID=A0A4U1BQX6_9GAMM|nr:hypothetical protein [Ferrimonas aestuarii]TKB57481.1 hypothetical protein FCL42_04190 [Ferrimonas aestuarii]